MAFRCVRVCNKNNKWKFVRARVCVCVYSVFVFEFVCVCVCVCVFMVLSISFKICRNAVRSLIMHATITSLDCGQVCAQNSNKAKTTPRKLCVWCVCVVCMYMRVCACLFDSIRCKQSPASKYKTEAIVAKRRLQL